MRLMIWRPLSFIAFPLLLTSAPVFGQTAQAPAAAPVATDATKATPTATPAPTFRTCDGGWADWKHELGRVESELEKWSEKHPDLMKSPDLTDHHEGRMIRLFAAHLLPKEYPFASLYKVCWAQYAEFERLVTDRNKAKADETLKSWENCVRGNEEGLPKEAEELLACWKSSPLK